MLFRSVFIAFGRFIFNLPVALLANFAVYLFFRALAVDWRLRGESRFKTNALITLSASVIQILAALIFVRPENWQIASALPWALHALVICLSSWSVTWLGESKKSYVTHLNRAMQHLAKSFGYSLSNGVSVLFQQSPVLILTAVYGSASVAGFALVHRVILSSVTLFQVVGTAVFPRLVKMAVHSSENAWHFTRKAMLLIAGSSIFVLGIGVGIVSIPLVRDAYIKDIKLLVLIAFSVFFVIRSMRIASARYLLASNMQYKYASLSITISAIFYFLVFVLFSIGQLNEVSIAAFFMLAEMGMLIATIMTAKRNNV